MDDLFLDMLRQAWNDKELVSLYDNPRNITRFSLGFVEAMDDKAVRLRAVNKLGALDGEEVHLYRNIVMLTHGGLYEERVARLMSHPPVRAAAAPQDAADGAGEDVMLATLRRAQAAGGFVQIWLPDEDTTVTGFVTRVAPPWVEIRAVDDYGRADGTAILRIDTIEDLHVDSDACLVMKALYELEQAKKGEQ